MGCNFFNLFGGCRCRNCERREFDRRRRRDCERRERRECERRDCRNCCRHDCYRSDCCDINIFWNS